MVLSIAESPPELPEHPVVSPKSVISRKVARTVREGGWKRSRRRLTVTAIASGQVNETRQKPRTSPAAHPTAVRRQNSFLETDVSESSFVENRHPERLLFFLSVATGSQDSTKVMKTSTIITLLNVTALVAMMLSMGMKETPRSLLASTRRWRLLVLGLIANYVLVPAVTVGLLILFQTNAAVSAGFLILATCPGAPFAPLVTAIARGDVPSAIALMLTLAGLSAFLTPAVLSLLVNRIAPGSDLHINPIAVVRTLLPTQMLPLALGMAIHHAALG